jgi:uncharacterized protein
MKIKIEHIGESPRSLTITEPATSFPALAAMVDSGECAFTGPVRSEIQASREADQYRVDGHVSVPVSTSCSRCLKPLDFNVSSRFTIYFRRETFSNSQANDEVELEERDLISTSFSGDELDLFPEIGEQVALEIPVKPLCKEQCKGICPSCGADLNSSPCNCNTEDFPHKFNALKDFKVNRK